MQSDPCWAYVARHLTSLASLWAVPLRGCCWRAQGLFVGSVGAAYNKAALLENRIRAVVVVANSLQPLFPDDFSYTLVDGESLY